MARKIPPSREGRASGRSAAALSGDREDGEAGALEAEDWRIIRRLFSENFPAHARHYAVALVLLAVTAGATGASAWVMKDIVNSIFVAQRGDLLAPIALTVVLIFLVKGLATYGATVLMARIGARVISNIKKRLVSRIVRQGLTFFDRHSSGMLTTKLNQQANSAREVMNTLVAAGARDLLALIALVGVMIAQDPMLAMLTLLIGPPAILGLNEIVRRTKNLSREETAGIAVFVQDLMEMVRGMRIIQVFGLEQQRERALYRSLDDVERKQVKLTRLTAAASPLMETLGGVGIAAIVAYGGWRVISGANDPGAFFSFITAFLMAYEPAKRLANIQIQMKRKVMHLRMLYELLDEPLTMADAPGAPPLAIGPGRIAFEAVSFAYARRPALREVDLVVEPGEFLAVVGASGAGKTTLFSLLSRFYDPTGGRILIDGQDIALVSLASLRRAMAVVTQEAFLFSGTIRENIMMARPGASEADFRRVTGAALVDEFVSELRLGYDTALGEGGSGLSGGQKQRVSIARAMLKDAPILLLDEATSALDTRSEMLVQEALDHLRRGRTSLVIAHRLSTVRNADRIAVFKAGQLHELGTHQELLDRSGEFRELYELQFGAESQAAE